MAHSIPVATDTSGEAIAAELLPPGVLRTFLLVSGLFFLWGMPNNLNDILIRQFMKAFAINRFQAGLVQSAFYLGYFVMALPAGMLIRHRGYKAGFLTGLLLFATGALLFLPAAYVGRYGFFLTALFVLASGLSFLETSANPFVAQLGPGASSERRLNIAQAFNPIGAIAGALAGSLFIFSGIELTPSQTAAMQQAGTYTAYLHRETLRVVAPYVVLGCLAILWAIMIGLTRFPRFIAEREHAAEERGHWQALLRERHLLFALVALFLYVGAQVGTWSYFIQYAQEYAHVPERTAGYLLTGTLVAFGVGRSSSAYLMRRFLPSRLMAAYAGCNIVLLLFGILMPGWGGLSAIFLTSFFMSLMFPTIFALGLKDLGPNTNIAGSWLIMMIIGGGVLTPLMGWVAEGPRGTANAYALPLLGFVVILCFSLYMTRYTRERLVRSTFEV